MYKKRFLCIFPVHSAAVIRYTDKRDPATCKFHSDPGGTAVYGIIEKFLYNGNRTFYDLSGLYGIGGLCIKDINSAQRLPPSTSASIRKGYSLPQ